MNIRLMGPEDGQRLHESGHLFDDLPLADAVDRFLADPSHHILIAYEDDLAVGFVSGVETTHPDKGTEMFLYELAVDEPHRRRGIGQALVAELAELAAGRGCYAMWVLTEESNAAALGTYQAAGAVRAQGPVMLEWTFPKSAPETLTLADGPAAGSDPTSPRT